MEYPNIWSAVTGVDQIKTDKTTRRISLRTPDKVRTKEEVFPIYTISKGRREKVRTKKTTATLRQNATAAFINNIVTPASKIAETLNLGPSKIKQQIAFINAQTYPRRNN